MKAIVLVFALTISFSHIFAQKLPIKFGEVPVEDLKMKVYEKDSSANAVVLADYGESTMKYTDENGFAVNYQRITRIKILKTEGLEWSNFSIQLYHNNGSSEKVMGLKGITHNLEAGKVVETKMKDENFFKEKYDDNNDFIKIALPNVRVGSVVEISYTTVSEFVFNFQDWTFQYTIPVRWSEYRASIPEYFNYEKYMQGYVVLDVSEATQGNGSVTLTSSQLTNYGFGPQTGSQLQSERIDFLEYRYRWAAKDVPAFKEEPYMTTYKDFISKINFELSYTKFPNQAMNSYMGSWKEINDTYMESPNLGEAIKGNGHLKDIAAQLTAGLATPEEKIAAVHQYVRDNFQWDGTTRKFADTPLRKVMDEKKGSSAELNLLVGSILEKAEIEVHPVLISTRDNGFVRETMPISSQFNNTLSMAKVGTKYILLDATQKLLPTGFLPARCLNGKGLVISKPGHSWVDLTAPVRSREARNVELVMGDDGKCSGKISIERTGYYAEKGRKQYQSKGETDYVKEFVGGNAWEISKSTFENAKQLNASLKENHELSSAEVATVAGDVVYINPLIIGRLDENPFKLEARQYPVDFGSAFDESFFVKLTIPAGYSVDEIPVAKGIALPGNAGKFVYSATQSGNMITVTSTLQISRPLFVQTEYQALREFYSIVVAKQAEQIVLKKK